MPTVDYALAYDFIEPAAPEVSHQLQFHYPYIPNEAGGLRNSNPRGQLVAEISHPGHPDHRQLIAISRPAVTYNDVEAAVDSDHWPWYAPGKIDLAEIRRRVHAAGLGYGQDLL